VRKYFSILFALAIFATLSLYSSKAEAQVQQIPALTAEEATLIYRDSDNAHQVAKAALATVSCMLAALQEGADWTQQDCVDRLRPVLDNFGQEHQLLHPRVNAMLAQKMTQRDS